MSQEQFSQVPLTEQQTAQELTDRFHNTARTLRAKLGRLTAASLLTASTVGACISEEIVFPSEADASNTVVYGTLGYPWYNAPCEYGAAGGASCDGANGDYEWGEYVNGVFQPYRNSYEYRNCTDYVQWRSSQVGITVPTGWGDGGNWLKAAPASEETTTPLDWDVAVSPSNDHVAFVELVNSTDPNNPGNDNITVSEYNYDMEGDGDTRTATASSMGFTEFVDFGVHPSGGSGSGPYPHGYIDTSAAIDAKSTPGWLNYTQEVGSGNATQFVMAGNYQMFLRGDGTVFAKNTMGPGGWVQETNAQGATAIAVSDTGLQLIIAPDAEVDSRSTIGGPGGWTQEVGPGNANAIALGGNNMMFLRGDDTVFAKTGAGGAWTQETLSGAATAIATGPSGLQLLIEPNGEVDSRTFPASFGGWTAETYPDSAEAITAG
jgi:surface antigen